MKKFLSILLVIGMLMSVMSLSVSAANETTFTDEEKAALLTTMRRADVDNNGVYSTNDAQILLKAAAGITEYNEEYDVDLDGKVSLVDVQKILRVAAGVDSLLTNEKLLEIFKDSLNDVKKVKPGFYKTETTTYKSIKVTTTGSPISQLNVSNMEYSNYVYTFIDVMNTWPYDSILDDEMKAELKVMEQSAVDMYKPQVTNKRVASTSNSHYTYFPVNNLGWSCNLDISDIKSINYTIVDNCFEITVSFANVSYGKGQYPTGTSGFSQRQKLPYGKVFNLPAFDESDGTVLNSAAFNNGVVVLKIDCETGSAVSVDYGYSYTSNVTAAQAEDSSLVMKTVTNATVTENYVIGE